MNTFTEYWQSLTSAQKLELAASCGTTKGHLQNVAYGFKSLADGLCVAVEAHSRGQLRCETLRDDISWRRVPDADWPWHPEGKPLIDLMPEVSTQEVGEVGHG